MRCTDLDDTSPKIHRMIVERLRRMTILEKATRLNARIEEMRQVRRHTEYLRPPRRT